MVHTSPMSRLWQLAREALGLIIRQLLHLSIGWLDAYSKPSQGPSSIWIWQTCDTHRAIRSVGGGKLGRCTKYARKRVANVRGSRCNCDYRCECSARSISRPRGKRFRSSGPTRKASSVASLHATDVAVLFPDQHLPVSGCCEISTPRQERPLPHHAHLHHMHPSPDEVGFVRVSHSPAAGNTLLVANYARDSSTPSRYSPSIPGFSFETGGA